jgi:micrococcal nuclease
VRSLIIGVIIFVAGGATGYLVALHGPSFGTPAAAQRTVDLTVVDGGVYRVRKVVDGDTIVLENGLHVRYHGINTPETGHFVKDAAPLSLEASNRNAQLVEGKRVKLTLPKDPLDIHGRLVASVEVVADTDGVPPTAEQKNPARTLLTEGYARIMGLGVGHEEMSELKQIEADAKARKAGIWGLEDKVRADSNGKPYIAASAGSVYHLKTCSVAQRIKNGNLHEYASAEEAEAAGYKPCSKCVGKE